MNETNIPKNACHFAAQKSRKLKQIQCLMVPQPRKYTRPYTSELNHYMNKNINISKQSSLNKVLIV